MSLQYLYQIQGISLKRSLEISGYSDLYIKNNEWKYHYVVTKILNKRRFTTCKNGWVRLNIEGLRTVLGSSSLKGVSFRFIDRIRKDLKEWGLIKTKYRKQVGEDGSILKFVYAKVLDEYTALGWHRWVPNKLVKLAIKEPKLTGIYAKLKRSLSLLTIDAVAAREFAETAKRSRMKLPTKLVGWKRKQRVVNEEVVAAWNMAIDAIESGSYTVRVEFKNSGRVYTAISSFPRLLRSYLRLNGKWLIGLDCANSQPLLFGVYLRQHYELTEDMQRWISLCEAGKLYDTIRELLIDNGCKVPDDKKAFKTAFFASLFYSKEKKPHQWRTVFAKEFPAVAEAISVAKKAGPGKTGQPELLTAQLSLLESEIMIKGVARRLYEAGINEFVTLHDCILTTEGYTDVVYNVIREEYLKYGVEPKINIEE